LFTLTAVLAGGTALAQRQEGLVNVNVSDIRVELADLIDVQENQIPVTVQVPIGVAANVCDVNANVLAEQARNGTANCDAENTSTALARAVQRQIAD
jgi:hypothetical protein